MENSKLKLLLDENIGIFTIMFLRKRGHDVVGVLELNRGIPDEAVLARAVAQNRILVTLDRDIGRLIYRHSHKHVGVIFIRLKKESAKNINATLGIVLATYGEKLYGKFTTASQSSIRIK